MMDVNQKISINLKLILKGADISVESNTKTFGELDIDDRFIYFPSDGDDSGHGGYNDVYNIFQKTDWNKGIMVKYATESQFPTTMEVIQVQ